MKTIHKITLPAFLLISILTTSPAFAESYAFEQDKQKHATVGAGVAGLATLITQDRAIGISVATAAGVAKELYDYSHGKKFSTADIAWTVAGGITGAYVAGLIITPHSISYNWKF